MQKQFDHLQQDDLQEDDYKIKKISKKQKIIYFLLIISFIGSTILNLLVSNYQYSNIQKLEKGLQVSEKRINQSIILQKKSLSKLLGENFIKYNFSLSDQVKERISYGEPRPRNYFLRAAVINRKNGQYKNNLLSCVLTNGVTIISNKTTFTGKNFLFQQSIRKWVLLLGEVDEIADNLLKKLIVDLGGDYEIEIYPITINSNYEILINILNGCRSVVYLQNNFILNRMDVNNILNITNRIQKQKQQGYLYYTNKVIKNQIVIMLQNLNNINLVNFQQEKFYQYVFVFDTQFLEFIAPVNFINFNKYTIQQIIIYPILVITQKSQSIKPINQVLYTFDEAVVQFKQFQLPQPSLIGFPYHDFCFVGYPTLPNQFSIKEFQLYVDSIEKLNVVNQAIAIVVHFPYSFEGKGSLHEIYKIIREKKKERNSKLLIKLVIKESKVYSSLSVYESARIYCSQKSMMIASRYNIQFNGNFIKQLSSVISQKYHYYYSGNVNFNERKNVEKVLLGEGGKRFNVENYIKYFSGLQIFKNGFMKMINPWMLKIQESLFMESEAAFVLPMLEMIDYNIKGVSLLYKVNKVRRTSQQEHKQLQLLNSFGRWDKISDNILKPIQYNPLVNLQLRRGTLDSIPKIIHQIWFKDDQIPRKIKLLQRTIREINKDFTYMLWRKQNLTFYNFPLSYPLIVRTLQYEWASGKSYHLWAQALFSYQVLYNHGGIYLGLNVQAVQPLNPFLKYQLFFAGYYNTDGYYDMPLSFCRDVIGSKRYGYHLKMVLTEIITAKRVIYELQDYEAMIGGDVLRLSMTDRQVYTNVGFGFYLFNYDPYRDLHKKCKENKDQCKSFNEFYILLHNVSQQIK